LAAASSAICSCFVNTSIFGSVSSLLVFPNNSFLSPTSPFPTQWLPRVGSPPFTRYYEDAKTSVCSSRLSSYSFETRLLPLLHLLSLASGRGVPPAAPGRWSSGFATCSGSFYRKKSVGSLKFPGNPFSAFALLSDPGRFSTPSPLRRFDAAPAVMTTKAPTLVLFSIRLHALPHFPGFLTRHNPRSLYRKVPSPLCTLPKSRRSCRRYL